MRHISTIIIVVLGILSCNSTELQTETEQLTAQIKIPDGWNREKEGIFERVSSPEKDLKIYFYKEKFDRKTSGSGL